MPERLPPLPAVEYRARWFRWECSCGAKDLPIRIDRYGRPYAKCSACHRTIFWGDPAKFISNEPFCRHRLTPVPTRKKGFGTIWCNVCKMRIFERL